MVSTEKPVVDLRMAGHRLLAAAALALLAATPAFANTYAIGLFQTGTGTGSGSFTFTNGGSSGPATSPSVTTNVSSTPNIGVIIFTSGGTGLTAVVVPVKFSDGKTPPNLITGNYVEGLSGSLVVSNNGNQTFPGVADCSHNGDNCSATITFSYTACSPAPPGSCNPSAATKSYKIEISDKHGVVLPAYTVNGTYSVTDTVNSAPEPGSLALIAIGLGALAAFALARRRQTAENRSLN